MDWLEQLYSAAWQQRFQRRAQALYGHLEDIETMAEDAASMTAMKLSEAAEEPPSDAYILSVFRNALTDCVRERHGFPRPRKWLADLGDLGRALFKLVCLQGRTRQQVQRWVEEPDTAAELWPSGAPDLDAARRLALSTFDQMQEKQECAPWRRQMERDHSGEEGGYSPFDWLSGEGDSPEQDAALDQVRHFVEALAGALDAPDGGELDRRRLHQLADQQWEALGLDAADRLVIKAYLDRGVAGERGGLSEQEMACSLGLSVPQIRNRRKKALAAVRGLFA